MARVRFTARAEADLLDIGVYTLRTWSEQQCGRYLDALEDCCQLLADNPELGHRCDHIRPGLRSFEQARHVVFYREQRDGVLVVRILHQRMLPGRHNLDDD